jgi:D-aminopeptidase
MTRARIRDLGISIGIMTTGQHNAITDVPGVLVGHTTLIYDEPRVAHTGVTVILPRGDVAEDHVFAGYFSFNGYGEMTGLPWMDEAGMLDSPVAITNTHQVGIVRDALVSYVIEHGREGWLLPLVAETYDGFLNDINAFHVTKEHVYQALSSTRGGAVDECSVGGGTGMMCHGFKGGIGTASRMAETASGSFTVGALVQANYGARHLLRVDGVPVGREIGPDVVPLPSESSAGDGSIIVVVATDAPLLPTQCRRLAKRATVGLARAGGTGHNGSGDIFLAFATGNHLPNRAAAPYDLKMLPNVQMNPILDAVAEAVEESIPNALTAAGTMTGYKGRTAHALPLDELKRVMAKYRPAKSST